MSRGIHENSIRAYWEGNDELFGKRHQKIISALRASRDSLTDREIMVRCGFTDPNAVRPRITELTECGVLVEIGKTECPVTKKTVRLVKLAKREAQAEFDLDAVAKIVSETL